MVVLDQKTNQKTNALLKINEKDDDRLYNNIYLYAKDLIEPKYEFLVKKREDAGIKHLNFSNALTECSNTMDDVSEYFDDYNPNRKRKILIASDDMIAEIMTNKKFQAIIKELFIKCRKLNISLAFIAQSYLNVLIILKLVLSGIYLHYGNESELKP